MWTAIIFPLCFDEVIYDLGYGKGQINEGKYYIILLYLSLYSENY